MKDLIDRQALLAEYDRHHVGKPGRARKLIEDAPSAEPERKKGEWIYGENDGQDGWFCSECGFFIPWYYEYYGLDNIDFISDYRTCPKCDANMIKYTGMRGEQDGTEK